MTATDVAPDRLEAARSAAERFLDEAPDELRVGAVSFSDTAHVLQPPTTDHEQVRAALTGLTADGGTATGDGLAAALETLDTGSQAPAGRGRAAVRRQADRRPRRRCGRPGGGRAEGTRLHRRARHARRRRRRLPARPARSRGTAADRRGVRRAGVRGLRRRPAHGRLRAARLPARHARGDARGHGRLRGRGTTAARRRAGRLGTGLRAPPLRKGGGGWTRRSGAPVRSGRPRRASRARGPRRSGAPRRRGTRAARSGGCRPASGSRRR